MDEYNNNITLNASQENAGYLTASLDLEEINIIDVSQIEPTDAGKKKADQSVPGKPAFIFY